MRAQFPKGFKIDDGTTVDICMVLNEPTLAIDLTATLSGHEIVDSALDAIALSIAEHAHGDPEARGPGALPSPRQRISSPRP